MMKLALVVIVDPCDAPVKEINDEIHVEHGNAALYSREFFGMRMAKAFIITSKRAVVPAAKKSLKHRPLRKHRGSKRAASRARKQAFKL